MKNKITGKEQFKELLRDDMTIMFGGFMACGASRVLIDAIYESGVRNITAISSDAGWEDKGLGRLIQSGQVTKLLASHIGLNPIVGKKMQDGVLDVELIPQGTLVERIRSGGAGLGGVLTPTGLGTEVEAGKQIIEVKGKAYLLEEPLRADLAVIKGHQVDVMGNVVYLGTERNFNPIMATASDVVVVSADEVVEKGAFNPDFIITPHVLVDYIVMEEMDENIHS